MLKHYQCHKTVHAEPMLRGTYNKLRGWEIPIDEDPADEGYRVVYNKGTDSEHVSWSPKDVFEEGYFEIQDTESETPILQFFSYEHLPAHLQRISRPVGILARFMANVLPNSAETSAGLRKLLEAKDCFVRALLEK